jgi:uncharacterized protein
MVETVDAGARPGRVLVVEGLFVEPQEPDGRARLIGSRCPSCGESFFPRRHVCLRCYHEGLDDTEIGAHGTLWSYTEARQQSPAAVIQVPYVIAQVKVDEGPVVQALLTEREGSGLQVGMELELIVAPIGLNEQGQEVMAHQYRPVRSGATERSE